MTLPASGPISLNDIQTEFGGSAPTSIDEYYRNGIYVTTNPTTGAIPTGGQVSFSDYYGSSNYTSPVISFTSQTRSRTGGRAIGCFIRLNSAIPGFRGQILEYWYINNGATNQTPLGNYCNSPTLNYLKCEAFAALISQSGTTVSGTFNTWFDLNTPTDVLWGVSKNVFDSVGSANVTFNLTIREKLVPSNSVTQTMSCSITAS